MAERLVVVEKEKISYDGLFESKELINVIKQWAADKGYAYFETSHTETTKPEGKYADITLAPFKKFTDYAKSIIRVRVQLNDVKDAIIERDNKKSKVQDGKAAITFEGILETDYEHRWESKPSFFIIRLIFHKYVYSPFISQHEKQIKDDLSTLKNNLKSFLNLTQYQ